MLMFKIVFATLFLIAGLGFLFASLVMVTSSAEGWWIRAIIGLALILAACVISSLPRPAPTNPPR